jgi:hypothetical protein
MKPAQAFRASVQASTPEEIISAGSSELAIKTRAVATRPAATSDISDKLQTAAVKRVGRLDLPFTGAEGVIWIIGYHREQWLKLNAAAAQRLPISSESPS